MKSFGHYKIKDYYDHGMKEFPLGSRAFLAISENATWLYTKIVFPWKVEQAEKFWKGWKPGSTGRVLVMNHVSMLDPVILSMLLYHHGIRIHPISKSEFDKNRFVSWAFSRYGCIPVHRGTADLKAIRHARDALKKGDWILVFPEGTRIKSDDQPVTIHGGFALMAQLANATVQPVAIVGARDITPKGTHFPRPRRVFLKVGDEIHFEDLGIEKSMTKSTQWRNWRWTRYMSSVPSSGKSTRGRCRGYGDNQHCTGSRDVLRGGTSLEDGTQSRGSR